jgi:hypothetical protein
MHGVQMKQRINQLQAVTMVILLVCSLALAISINATCANGEVNVQTIDDEPIDEQTATPTPTPSASPTPQPTSGTSVFSVIMSNFDILGLARLILIAIGVLWVIVILRALDQNFGRKKPKQ